MFELIHDLAPGSAAGDTALVMLPGARMRAQDFALHGFVETLRERGLAIDAVMVDVDANDYVSPLFGKRMGEQIVDVLQASGYRHIWLAGISLGAYGAMRLLQERLGDIGGMLLIAPFLSTRGTIARILGAGGLDGWSPQPEEYEGADESLLYWLKGNLVEGALPLEVYLGWGEEDRYADAGRLLAPRLPSDRIFRIRGDHDWSTWGVLWNNMLEAAPFAFADGNTGKGLQ